MKKRTERKTYLAGLLAVIAGAFAVEPGCGEDEECAAPEVSCDGVCVDTGTDPSHCGGCNNACPLGQECVGGVCQCPAGTSYCSGACIATDTDPSNCGGCGIQCDEFEECVGGTCRCPDGMAECTTGCADLMTDKLNCGQCNRACGAGQSCVNGECVCPDNKTLCYSQCVDTTSDANFCGDCDTACNDGEYCNASNCETISSCAQVSMDQYEDNETCADAHALPDAAEGAPTAVTVSDATLHHTDGSLDTDWYSMRAIEGTHICVPLTGQCYFYFDIAFTPPDAAAYAVYEMCVSSGTCGENEICTTAAEWNAGAGRYELSLYWQGTCGLNDDQQFYVKIGRNGGEENCEQYSLEYQMTFSSEGCP